MFDMLDPLPLATCFVVVNWNLDTLDQTLSLDRDDEKLPGFGGICSIFRLVQIYENSLMCPFYM